MNNSSGPAQNPDSGQHEEAKLEFPVEPDFMSKPPRLPFETMQRRWEETMPWLSARPGERERRLAEKIDVEFIL